MSIALKEYNEVNNIEVFRIFFKVNDQQELVRFYYEVLGKLIQYDQEKKASLVETLKLYLEENCNLIETAEKLYLHRNAVKYRLQRIEKITGTDLKNLNTKLNFKLAYDIRDFLSLGGNSEYKIHNVE